MYARPGLRIFMTDIILLAQTFVDVLAWFILPFAVILAVSWVTGLFRR